MTKRKVDTIKHIFYYLIGVAIIVGFLLYITSGELVDGKTSTDSPKLLSIDNSTNNIKKFPKIRNKVTLNSQTIYDKLNLYYKSSTSNTSFVQLDVTKKQYDIYHIPISQDLQIYMQDKCEEMGISYEMMVAIAYVESRFNPNNISPSGDYGRYQLNKASGTLKWLGDWVVRDYDSINSFQWRNPKHSFLAAITYVDWLRQQFDGASEEQKFGLVLLSYNMGMSNAKHYIKHHSPYDWKYVRLVQVYKTKLENGEIGVDTIEISR